MQDPEINKIWRGWGSAGSQSWIYLRRQEALVDYLNQSAKKSLLASSFYDRVFFRKVLEYLAEFPCDWGEQIFDIGCGNGIFSSRNGDETAVFEATVFQKEKKIA